jgi:hypothetical protein
VKEIKKIIQREFKSNKRRQRQMFAIDAHEEERKLNQVISYKNKLICAVKKNGRSYQGTGRN